MSGGRVRYAIGSPGSGKTYKLKLEVARTLRARPDGYRFVVLDLNDEWPGTPANGEPRLRIAMCEGANASAAGVRKALGLVSYVVVRSKKRGAKNNLSLAEDVAGAVLEAERTIMVVPEAHEFLPEHKDPTDNIRELVHRFRHSACGLWGDTQNFAYLSKRAIKQSELMYMFAMAWPEELAVCRRIGGRELAEAVSECASRYDGGDGEPGWHVVVRTGNPRPPFPLVR